MVLLFIRNNLTPFLLSNYLTLNSAVTKPIASLFFIKDVCAQDWHSGLELSSIAINSSCCISFSCLYLWDCVCVLSHSVVSFSWGPISYSLPGSSVHGVVQARILEWVTISFSRGSTPPRNRTQVSWSHTGHKAYVIMFFQ